MNFQENPFQKNMEMWQQFSSAYTENMMAMFEKNMAQSQAFQQQIREAVSQVVNSQFEMVITSLKTLENQMASLTKTINEMAQTKK